MLFRSKEETEWVDISPMKTTINMKIRQMYELPYNKDEWWEIAISGFPNDMRGEIWIHLVNPKHLNIRDKYESLINDKPCLKTDEDIEKDIKRTFSFIPKFIESQSTRLFNVLKAYSRLDSKVGYCQGMNYVVGFLLLYIKDEADAFCVFVDFMEKYNWRKVYMKGMQKLTMMIDDLKMKISKRLPEINQHINELDVNLYGIVSHLYFTIFIYYTPLDFAARVFDLFLIGGESVITETILIIMELMQDEIMKEKTINIHEYIRCKMIENCYKKHGADLIINLLNNC